MSFLKKLFGGGTSAGTAAAGPKKQLEYNGFLIAATPYKEGGQWQTCGTVSKTIDGAVKQHRFIRADRFSDEVYGNDFRRVKNLSTVLAWIETKEPIEWKFFR